MDFTLDQIPVGGYICPLETVLYQEETQESIVPDACPDIGSILATEASPQLTKKECGEGKAELWGNVRVTVVYAPEGEEGARKLELNIPYRMSAAAEGMDSAGALVAAPYVTRAETRALNPRKVLCRVELAAVCQGWSQNPETLCRPCPEERELQQRCQQEESYQVTAVAEKAFSYTDQVSLSSSYPAAEELLGYRVELRCAEAKVIGSKLIFKGEAVLQARYRGEDGSLNVGRWELPFSQIMEVNAAEEEGSCTVELVERGGEVTLEPEGDGRTLNARLEILAQAVVRQSRTLELFCDAYSVNAHVSAQVRELSLCQRWEESGMSQMGRGMLETDAPVRSVVDCFLTPSPVQLQQGEKSALTAKTGVTALYLDEGGQLRAATGEMTFTGELMLPEDGNCLARWQLSGDIQALPAAGGIEVRSGARFSYLITRQKRVTSVVALEQDEEEAPRQASVVLRLAQAGESLWDIAKAYSTTQEAILNANEIQEPEKLEGQMLLIPRSR